ncbi:unnamed protein product [Rotaria socialis]|uniref:Uncharacterized protein n=1 Tax=Rotaria socialis TaxID=392032 RepID=A0A818F9M4_9BILA|nr:unnamed protein product [Rotaria socialis]
MLSYSIEHTTVLLPLLYGENTACKTSRICIVYDSTCSRTGTGCGSCSRTGAGCSSCSRTSTGCGSCSRTSTGCGSCSRAGTGCGSYNNLVPK